MKSADSDGKASGVLIEALDYMKKFRGQTFVIKLGGEIMVTDEVLDALAEDVTFLSYANIRPVIVHGGGKEITRAMDRFGKKPTFVKGLRVTDEETMEIVKMVLIGKVNSQIVARLNRHGGKAVGISGKSGKLFFAEKKRERGVDLGLVGKVTEVNQDVVTTLLDKGYIPVISPVGISEDGTALNINADTAAAQLAAALKADKFVILTSVDGVLDKKKQVIPRFDVKKAKQLIKDGTATEGMIPKLKAVVHALEEGVPNAHIIGARPHALLEEIFTKQGTGTMVSKK